MTSFEKTKIIPHFSLKRNTSIASTFMCHIIVAESYNRNLNNLPAPSNQNLIKKERKGNLFLFPK